MAGRPRRARLAAVPGPAGEPAMRHGAWVPGHTLASAAAQRWPAPTVLAPGCVFLAGIHRGPAEWMLAGAGVSLVLAIVLTVLFGNVLIALVLGALVGWLGMKFGLNFVIQRRRAKFADQLPDMLQFVAGSLRSGFSLGQGLDAAVREDTQPVAGEFSRALAESRIGVDLEDALDQVADRMESA